MGVPPCAPESTRTKHVMIKRAHTEERPYRLIVPVVLHFLPLAAHFRPLVRGGQEGIVPIIINRLIQDNPLLTPPS